MCAVFMFLENKDHHKKRLVISILSSSTPAGTPLFKPYRYVPPQRVEFSGLFGLKTDIDFAHFGLESGMVFEGTTGLLCCEIRLVGTFP